MLRTADKNMIATIPSITLLNQKDKKRTHTKKGEIKAIVQITQTQYIEFNCTNHLGHQEIHITILQNVKACLLKGE